MRALRYTPRIVIASAALGCAAAGCAGMGKPAFPRYRFFVAAEPGDVWFEKVRDWQQREVGGRPDVVRRAAEPDPRSGLLSKKFRAFADEEKRQLARRFVAWSQEQAMQHYRFDERQDLAGDDWPSSKDLFDRNGDDCDGLDLIAYNLLLDLGFREDEIYRAVIRRDLDGEFHMVTLWFEDPEDPWVLDTTGAMTMRMRRISDLPGWTPAVVFNASGHYTVRKLVPVSVSRTRADPGDVAEGEAPTRRR
jgi:hypothetical protein